ncbi:MAG: hypothetical protein HC769_14580 [Cyanobacteria bacterium CRU_2_1]|nr:hypothetical protein [Cyanobacteria bacterium RU_5_0]NJR59950.1 hypothetical protein [Cyanobacteria bacterium CRU_2_1]
MLRIDTAGFYRHSRNTLNQRDRSGSEDGVSNKVSQTNGLETELGRSALHQHQTAGIT